MTNLTASFSYKSKLKGINKQDIVHCNIPAKPMTTCSYAQIVRVFYAWNSPKMFTGKGDEPLH